MSDIYIKELISRGKLNQFFEIIRLDIVISWCKNSGIEYDEYKNGFRLLNLSCETSFLILILVEIMVGTNEALG